MFPFFPSSQKIRIKVRKRKDIRQQNSKIIKSIRCSSRATRKLEARTDQSNIPRIADTWKTITRIDQNRKKRINFSSDSQTYGRHLNINFQKVITARK